MAPIGSVIKNGLLFLILLIPIAYLGSRLLVYGITDVIYAGTDDSSGEFVGRSINDEVPNKDYFDTAVLEIALAVLLIFGLGGLVFMKSLSDSVEDGMVEF